jgi:fumarylacetoacetate (FAA) hydrolase
MKLGTLKNDTRDGILIVVSQDLTRAAKVSDICATMQGALDNWDQIEPLLQKVYSKLNAHTHPDIFQLNTHDLMAPLPRAYQWADGSAYVTHVELVRKARGAELPESFWHDPLMYQGGSDNFIGPNDPILAETEEYGIDFEAELVVITDDVPMTINSTDAIKHIKMIGLVNDVSLRNLIPNEISKFFGFFQSKPACSFAPVFVTPDELGLHWRDGKVHLPVRSTLNDTLFGQPNAGVDMTFNFPQLLAHAARTRKLGAGTIIGSGTVANKDPACGSSCIAEKRMREKIEFGEAKTPFLEFENKIKIEVLDDNHHSIFGAIEQSVQPHVSLLNYNDEII